MFMVNICFYAIGRSRHVKSRKESFAEINLNFELIAINRFSVVNN